MVEVGNEALAGGAGEPVTGAAVAAPDAGAVDPMALLARLEAGITAATALASALPADPDTATDVLDRMLAAMDRLDAAVQACVTQVVTSKATWKVAGVSPTTWLRRHCRRAGGEAKARVGLAERAQLAPDAAAAFDAGAVSRRHLEVITQVLDQLGPGDRGEGEAILLRAAHHLDPHDLSRLGRELLEVFAPADAAEREAARYARRHLTVATTFDGMVHLAGLLDQETGEALLAALLPWTKPTGADDRRTADQRRADALGQLSRHALASGGVPDGGGTRPQVIVTIDAATLYDLPALQSVRLGPGPQLAHTGPLTAEAARRLACDAAIIPAVLGGNGEVLDIGRATPTWPTPIRRAAALRDRGCTFPGCAAPLAMCELHHIWWYSRGGPTSLHNSAHLCGRHHRTLHAGLWTMRRRTDGTLIFTDPGGTDHPWQPPPTLDDYRSSG